MTQSQLEQQQQGPEGSNLRNLDAPLSRLGGMAAVCEACGVEPEEEPEAATLLALLNRRSALFLQRQSAALELDYRRQKQLVREITGCDELARKCAKIRDLRTHAESCVGKQAVINAKLAQPLASGGLYVDADHQADFIQLHQQLSEPFDPAMSMQRLQWADSLDHEIVSAHTYHFATLEIAKHARLLLPCISARVGASGAQLRM